MELEDLAKLWVFTSKLTWHSILGVCEGTSSTLKCLGTGRKVGSCNRILHDDGDSANHVVLYDDYDTCLVGVYPRNEGHESGG